MWSTERLRPAIAPSFVLGAALGAALALSACAAVPPPANGRVEHALTPLDHYPVHAVERGEDVAVAVHPHGALSPAQEAALAGFARSWREAGAAVPVVVSHPAGGGPDAQLTAQAAADRLVSFGVDPAALRLTAYDAGPEPGAPVTARFARLAAEAPDCSRGWDNLTSTLGNDVATHFGCAGAHNFAVMLADPRDLQTLRPMTPADAGRRAAVLDNYRKGAVTASAKDDQASGAISARVK